MNEIDRTLYVARVIIPLRTACSQSHILEVRDDGLQEKRLTKCIRYGVGAIARDEMVKVKVRWMSVGMRG